MKTIAAGNQKYAAGLLYTAVRAPQQELFDAIDALIVHQGGAVDNAYRAANLTYRNVSITMIALGILAILLGAAAAWIITRALTRQLGGEPGYAAEIVGGIADGDLTVPISLKQNDANSLLFAMRTMRDNLVQVVSQVRIGTDTIATASTQITAGNIDLSARTEQQAASLEETAAAMEELTATVRQNADNALQGNHLATAASDVAVKGGDVVAQVVQTMDDINHSSKKIVDIISVIHGIAFQTNILALNAAVEAAQAGTTMNEVVQSVKRVTDIMSEISAASHEQRQGIEQVNIAISQMDQVTQQNAALVEESAVAADSMKQQAFALSEVVNIFRMEAVK